MQEKSAMEKPPFNLDLPLRNRYPDAALNTQLSQRHGEYSTRGFRLPGQSPRQQKSGNTDEQTIALTKARLAIDEVDARIVELLKNRAEWVHEVGRIKKEGNSPSSFPNGKRPCSAS
ncbi:chorismate mutase [Akkermansia massiliensis]